MFVGQLYDDFAILATFQHIHQQAYFYHGS